jgi:hypothetical protein
MGILDDAIKEHLELKRQHGAAEDELKQLEDEAFGAAERPGEEGSAADALAEAPTEFMAQPEVEAPPEAEREGGTRSRRPDVADLQEPPPLPKPEAAEPEPPAEEEAPAMEHEAVPAPPEPEGEISTGPSTEEREAIAEQPTEMYDVEEELAGSQAAAPSEEELVEEEIDEPRLAPVDPLAGLDAESEEEAEEEYEEDDDFWDEKRLSDELDQALEAPSEVEETDEEGEEPEQALYEDAATEGEEPEPEQSERSVPSGEEDDLLEETPDFLEEAPEDDQLWFEQKPPKDFDFDD